MLKFYLELFDFYFKKINSFFIKYVAPRVAAIGIFFVILSPAVPIIGRYLHDNNAFTNLFGYQYTDIIIYSVFAALAISVFDALKKLIASLGFTSINSFITDSISISKDMTVSNANKKTRLDETISLNFPEFISKIQHPAANRNYKGGDPLKAVESARSRLLEHIARLRNNSIINLVIAVILAIGGIAVLASAYAEIENYRDKSTDNFKIYDFLVLILAPRISIAVFIQIFSYFFLLMYRSNIGDVKYFQNEITNLDCYAAAISITMKNNIHQSQKSTITSLMKTERNRLMSKNQRLISSTDDDQNLGKLIDLNKQLTGHIRSMEKNRDS